MLTDNKPKKNHVKKMCSVYSGNKASSYTENMKRLYRSFNYDENSAYNWTYPEFSLLYGSPVYEHASEAQKRVLNHLYWICFYNYVMGGEITTMVTNQLCCGAFFHLGDYGAVCHELDLETSQERVHVEAFRHVGHLTEIAIFGRTIFERPMPSYLDATITSPQSQACGWPTRLKLTVASLGISNSPFLATQYFTARGIRNIQAKVKEYQHSIYAREREKGGKFVCAPTLISHNHCFDEGFHTTTSKFISHDFAKDLGKPSKLEAFMANAMVWSAQRTIDKLSCAVPGIFVDDDQYMPLIYEMLQTDVFGMNHEGALHAVEESFCKEHEGFHVAAKYHKRALAQNREFVSGLDYLSPQNRELKAMAGASIKKSISSNIRAFERLRREVAV